jgi:hypothetical protein
MKRNCIQALVLIGAVVVGAWWFAPNLLAGGQPGRSESPTMQQPKRWEGVCARCGEGYTWQGPLRPVQRNCTRAVQGQSCNGAIIWQPVY